MLCLGVIYIEMGELNRHWLDQNVLNVHHVPMNLIVLHFYVTEETLCVENETTILKDFELVVEEMMDLRTDLSLVLLQSKSINYLMESDICNL